MLEMIVGGQKVKMQWVGSHKKYYENIKDEQGNQKYIYTGQNSVFYVDVYDLSDKSNKKVLVQCDYCGESIKKEYAKYNLESKNNEKHGVYKDCCEKCLHLKVREIYGTLDELPYVEKDEENKKIIYSKEFLISEFYRYEKEFGKYPKKCDIDAQEGYPSAHAFYTNWGSWNKFLAEIDIIGDKGWYKKDEQILKELYPKENYTISEINNNLIDKRSVYDIQKKIKQMGLTEKNILIHREYDLTKSSLDLFYESLNDLANDIGKCPTSKDYDSYTKLNKLPSRRLAEKILGKPFSKICIDIFSETNKNTKTNEELLNDLRELKYKLGRTPKANELQLHGIAEKKTYMRRFNMTYQELILSLGWELSTKKMNFNTEEEMLSGYEKLYKELGRIPTSEELRDCDYTSSANSYGKYFGSFKNVWDLLDIEYEPNQNISGGYVSKNKNGDICRSKQELEISNLLIDNNIKYTHELRYSYFDKKLNNKWRMDWYLDNYDIYVEYFGWYDESHLKRNTRVGKYSRKVKKKMNYCFKNGITIIDIYHNDLKNDYQGLKNKLSEYGIDLVI